MKKCWTFLLLLTLLFTGIVWGRGSEVQVLINKFNVGYPFEVFDGKYILTRGSNEKLSILNIENLKIEQTSIITSNVSRWYMSGKVICCVKDNNIKVIHRNNHRIDTFEIKCIGKALTVDKNVWSLTSHGNSIYVILTEFLSEDELGEEINSVITRLVKINYEKKTITNVYIRKIDHKNGLRGRPFGPYFVGKNEAIFSDYERIVKLNIVSGKVICSRQFAEAISSPLLIAKDEIYLTTYRDLLALNRNNLQQKWKIPYYRISSDYVAVQPIVFKNMLVLGTSYESFDGNQKNSESCGLSSYDLKSGKIIWKFGYKGELNVQPVVYGEYLYFTTYNYNSKMYSLLYVYNKFGEKVCKPLFLKNINLLAIDSKEELKLFGESVYKIQK